MWHDDALDDPSRMRHAGHDLLSLALMDSRNLLLYLLARDESAAALRLAARAGWYQEYWIARHLQRSRGESADPTSPRLAGVEPAIDEWLGPGSPPPAPALRAYLAQTLETTLELLAGSGDGDDALYFFRMSLLHEDRLCEQLLLRLPTEGPPPRADRDPLWLPAQRMRLGTEPQAGSGPASRGLVPYAERWAHEVAVPELEIDAQPVSWARYVEFAEDGGYDREALWSEAGWAWVQQQGRRAPRRVEQLRGGVIVQRASGGEAVSAQRPGWAAGAAADPATPAGAHPGPPAPAGQLARVAAQSPVMHVSRHEAEAWCRWAGRRLPTEPEWELAALQTARRGGVFGQVWEWVAGSARSWPGAGPLPPGSVEGGPQPGQGVQRGGSFATRARWRHARTRRFAMPQDDSGFCGFRSCAP